MPLEAGDVLGRFKIAKDIGSGGMCDIYLAIDGSNFQNVALKVLNRDRVSDERAIQQFVREGELASSFSHPNVVAFVDAGCDDGQHFIAYEYITGLSLYDLIKKQGALDVDLALSIVQDVSMGLLAAHQKGVIHCDIKPQNIMITEQNIIKLIDFGIAALSAEAKAAGTEVALSEMEDEEGEGNTGIIGTLLYAAPEQNQGQLVDTFSDIYSLGLVFYEIFSGKRVLKAGPQKMIILQQLTLLNKLQRLHEVNPEVPESVDELIRKMLAPRTTDRYKSAVELVEDIEKTLPKPDFSKQSELWKAKELAQLELSETYYWSAVNAIHEGRFMDALIQFDRLITLSPELLSNYIENIRKELVFFFWRLHTNYRAWDENLKDDAADKRLDVDTYLLVLQKLGYIISKMKMSDYVPILEKRISLVLRDCCDDEHRLKYFRSFLACCPYLERSVILLADYLDTCRRVGAENELNGIMGYLAANLEAEGLLPSAQYIYSEALRALPGTPMLEDGLKRVEESLSEFSGAHENFCKLFDVMAKKGDKSSSLNLSRRHLDEWSCDYEAMEKLVQLFDDSKDDSYKEILDVWHSLARYHFIQEDLLRAKKCAARVLRQDPGDLWCQCLLFELLLWEGKRIKGTTIFHDMSLELFMEMKLGRAAIAELERELKGTLADLSVYKKILAIARKQAIPLEKSGYYFEMGVLYLKKEDAEHAKRYILSAMEEAKDPKKIVARFKEVPSIGTIFSRREILETLQRLGRGH